MPATDPVALLLQLPSQLTRSIERPLQMQLVQNPHQLQISLRQTAGDVVNTRSTWIQQLRLALHRYQAIPLDHRFPLEPGNFPSAPSKTLWSYLISSRDLSRRPTMRD